MRVFRAAPFALLVLVAILFAAARGRAEPAGDATKHPASVAAEHPHHIAAASRREHERAERREPPSTHRHRSHHEFTAAAAKPAKAKPARGEAKAASRAAQPGKPPAKTAAKSEKKYEPPDPHKGTATGLPLPRFAALRSDDVNLRIGPGTRYPIEWVYKRRELPVEIEREFEVWRLVEDPDGVKGWVHQATLTGRRSFMVVGPERLLRQRPQDDAYPVARLKPGVVGRILHCDAGSQWCRVQAGDYRGWLQRNEFWGTIEGEAIN